MKKIYQYLLLIVLLILTGCSERELTFDRIYPNLAKIDEFKEKRQLEIEEEKKNAPNTIRETRPTPRSLLIYEPIDNVAKYANVSQYCWDYYLDCDERMKPQHPYDIITSKYSLPALTLSAKRTLEISVESGRGVVLPFPTRIEAYTYDYDKNLHLYQTVDDDTEGIKMFNLTLPSEPGLSMFLFKVFYKGEVQGISYHPFMIITK